MAPPIDFSNTVYSAAQLIFSRTITVRPRLGASYAARGIYDTMAVDVQGADGSIISDQRTILDIRDAEFGGAIPQQGDLIDVDGGGGLPLLGTFEVIGVDENGGGETTLTLRKVVAAKP